MIIMMIMMMMVMTTMMAMMTIINIMMMLILRCFRILTTIAIYSEDSTTAAILSIEKLNCVTLNVQCMQRRLPKRKIDK